MSEADPGDPWLPTTDQIVMASERAILAALDTNLLLAARTLRAEHAAALSDDKADEPSPPHLALAESILILAATLRTRPVNRVADRGLAEGYSWPHGTRYTRSVDEASGAAGG